MPPHVYTCVTMDNSTSMLVKVLIWGSIDAPNIDVSSWRVELGMGPGLLSGTLFILIFTTKPC